MADTNFNTGPNAMPGGSSEDPRVNSSAVAAEIKQAQILQQQTIKSLTETIEELSKQYQELVGNNKELSEQEQKVSAELQSKINSLNEILVSIKTSIANGEPVRSLASIGVKERIETFDKLSNVIKQYQKTNLEFMKQSGGQELDFDKWFDEFVQNEKINLKQLESTQENSLLLSDIKSMLRKSSTEFANVTDEELTEISKKTLKLSIEQKTRDLEFLQQNRDIIRLNKSAAMAEQDNVKKLISAASFDPSKPILEYGFKTVSRDMETLIKNTKHRSLLKIVSDLLGPMGPVIVGFIKFVILPVAFAVGMVIGLVVAQIIKLKRLASALTFKPIYEFLDGMRWLGKTLLDFGNNIKTFTKLQYPEFYRAVAEFFRQGLFHYRSLIFNLRKSLGFMDSFISPGELAYIKDGFLRKLRIPEISRAIGSSLETISKLFNRISKSRFGKIMGTVIDSMAAVGSEINYGLKTFGNFWREASASFKLFKSGGLTRALTLVDKFTFGILRVFNAGIAVGKSLGGIAGPLLTVFSLLADIPKLWKKIWSGDSREAIKGILTYITRALLEFAVFVFTDGLGNIATALVLNFDTVYKWFGPLFDLIIDVGEVIWETISSLYTDFVQPTLAAIAQILTVAVDVLFALLRPAIFGLRVIWKLISVTLFPLIKLVFWSIGWLFKKIGEGWWALYEMGIKPVVDVIQQFFDFLYEKFESFLRFFGLVEDKPKSATEKIAEAAEETKEEAKDMLGSGLEKFGDMKENISEGIQDGMNSKFAQDVKQGVSGEGFKDAIDDLKSIYSDKVTPVMDKLADKMNSLTDVLSKMYSQTADSMNRAASSAGASISGMQSQIQPAIAFATTPSSIRPIVPRISSTDQYGNMLEAIKKTGSVVAPVTNVVNNNYYGSGGGGGTQILPLPESSTNNDPTKQQVGSSSRPPG